MDLPDIVSDLGRLASWPQAFTLGELRDFVNSDVDRERFREALLRDSRFICLRSEPPDEDRFILGSTLFRWFNNLNLRLAQAGQFRLGERQVALLMSHLRREGRWETPPAEAILRGRSLGFIGPSYTAGQYVFPWAWILSFLPPPHLCPATEVLRNFLEQQPWQRPLGQVLQETLQQGFAQYNPRVAHIVQARAGLLTGTRRTLKQVGVDLGLRSRERVRQLEDKFWAKLRCFKDRRWQMDPDARPRDSRDRPWFCSFCDAKRWRPFLIALGCDFMAESGSLILHAHAANAPLRKFLAQCLGIPYVDLPQMGLSILAASARPFAFLESADWFPAELDADAIAHRVEAEGQVPLVDRDVNVLAETVAQFRRSHLLKAQKVYLTLRAIGHPAHYSQIAEVYNSLFPEQPSTEHNLHQILTRKRYGVVWTGARGMYTLKEWGYERPAQTGSER